MSGPKEVSRPRSELAAMLEGAPADAFITLATGSALTGWALAYDAPPLYIAALQSLFVGMQVLHPPFAWLTQRAPRRRLSTTAVLVSRLVWLVMAAAALLDVPREQALPLLFVVAAVSAGAHVLRENALGTWLGDVVPALRRGRFFAARSRYGVAAASVGSLLLALLLDGDAAIDRRALAVLASLVACLGVLSTSLFQRMEAPPPPPKEQATLSETWADARIHPFLHYQLLFAFAVSPGLAFFSFWVLSPMEGSYLVLAAHALLLAAARILSAPLWGRLVDGRGARTVLTACSVGTCLMPLLWTTLQPGFFWPLVLDAIVAGTLWGGHAIAMFDVPLRISKPANRPHVLGLGAVAAGAGWILGSLFFGRLAEGLGAAGVEEPLRVVFGLCAVLRIATGFLALRVLEDREHVPAAATSNA